MELKTVEKINEKYKKLYEEEMNRKPAEQDENEPIDCIRTSDGKYVPATPLGYDDESLKFGTITTVIQTVANDKDYVLWGESAYTKKHPLETKAGDLLKAYDPVLILDAFGYPSSFVMFTGKYEIDGDYIIPHFEYIRGDDVRNYKPKCYHRTTD